MPDPVAWKEIAHTSSGAEVVVVALAEGNRWRTEARKPPGSRIVVNVFDGVTLASSNPNIKEPIAVDPASMLRNLFSRLNRMRPVATGERDGHLCWLFRENSQGGDAGRFGVGGEDWVDKQTFFPVLLDFSTPDGKRGEVHFQLLKSDFTILGKTCFDTRNLTPMLAPFLNP